MHVLTATLVKLTYKRQLKSQVFKIRLKYDLNAFQIDLDAPKANAAYDHAKAMGKAVASLIVKPTDLPIALE